MAKVRNVKYVFKASGSPDVAGYKMYYVETGAGELNYSAASVDIGIPPVNPDTGKMEVDLVALNIFTKEVNYDIGVVAVDDVGNESSMDKVLDVPFDLVAPDAPTDSEVIRV